MKNIGQKKLLVLISLFILSLVLFIISCSGSTKTTVPGKGPLITAKGVIFYFNPPKGTKTVFIAASFNGWVPDDSTYELKGPDEDGYWSKLLPLPKGKYEYKFVVNGRLQHDPNALKTIPDGVGGKKSLIIIK